MPRRELLRVFTEKTAVPVNLPPTHLADQRKQERTTPADGVAHRSRNFRHQTG
jgi:hypothetical protein